MTMSEFVGAIRFSNSALLTFSLPENGRRSSSHENCLTDAFNMINPLLAYGLEAWSPKKWACVLKNREILP